MCAAWSKLAGAREEVPVYFLVPGWDRRRWSERQGPERLVHGWLVGEESGFALALAIIMIVLINCTNL